MKFSQRSEYGVRLMVDLARHFGRGPLSLSEVAREEDLSQTFLEQVIMPLRKAGLVRSRQGVRGGYELSRPPQEIHMGEVLRVLEGSLGPMFCVADASDRDICAFEEHCATRVLWARVRDGINQALDSTTLADLLPPTVVHVGAGTISMALPMVTAQQTCSEYQPANG
jgi:Rrf2 family protein